MNVIAGQISSTDFTLDPLIIRTGSIKVTSEPAGVKIFINGVDTGKQTPYTFNDKPVGTYEVYVTKIGYVTPAIQTKAVVNDKKTEFNFELKRVQPDHRKYQGHFKPAGAKIFINGVDTGKQTPYTFNDKPVGTYEVYVTKIGYVTPAIQTKAVVNDKKTEFNFELKRVQPVTRSIKVTSEPAGAKIFINGVDTGTDSVYIQR